jgi:hypothetical protein
VTVVIVTTLGRREMTLAPDPDHLIGMPFFWLVCILHIEHSFLVCVVNEFCISKHHHHHHR